MQSAFVAAPFALLAVWATREKQRGDPRFCRSFVAAAAVGALLTVLLCAVQFYDGYVYWAERQTGGANIGLGCVMLVSPLPVFGAMALARRLTARPSTRSRSPD